MCLFCFGAKKQWFIKELGAVEGKLQPATTTQPSGAESCVFLRKMVSAAGLVSWLACLKWAGTAGQAGKRRVLDNWALLQQQQPGGIQRLPLSPDRREKKSLRGAGPAGRSLSLKRWNRELLFCGHCYDECNERCNRPCKKMWRRKGGVLQLPLAALSHFLCWGHTSLYK